MWISWKPPHRDGVTYVDQLPQFVAGVFGQHWRNIGMQIGLALVVLLPNAFHRFGIDADIRPLLVDGLQMGCRLFSELSCV